MGLAASSPSCATRNLRRRGADESVSRKERERGREWLRSALEAQGGLGALAQHDDLRLVFRDRWQKSTHGPFRRPWASDGALLQLEIALGLEEAKLTFLEGEATGTSWTQRRGKIHRRVSEAQDANLADGINAEDLTFWLRALDFAPLALVRLRAAATVYAVGRSSRGTRPHEVVYVETRANDAHSDQFEVWIDAETKLVRFIDRTVRALGNEITLTFAYQDYREVGGFRLAHKITTLDDAGAIIHRLDIESASLD